MGREKRTVLYAEDEKALQGLVEFWLEDAGFRVILADDGAIALAAIRAERPDLLITDAMMPNMTGDELVETLRSEPEFADLPIMMATAAASPVRVQRMKERGCYAVLSKPLDEDSFLATVRAAMGLD